MLMLSMNTLKTNMYQNIAQKEQLTQDMFVGKERANGEGWKLLKTVHIKMMYTWH